MTPIYLEPDEEITSVIDKLAEAQGKQVAVVVPKTSTLFQSLVNLKLLAKEAKALGKEVALISGNKIGQRLASQVGLTTYASLGAIGQTEAVPAPESVASETVTEEPEPEVEDEMINGVLVRQYNPNRPVTSQPTEPVEPKEVLPTAEAVPAEPEVEEPVIEEIAAPNHESTEPTEENNIVSDKPVLPETAPVTPPHEPLPVVVPRSHPMRERKPFVIPWPAVAIAGLILLLLLGATYLFLPRATVTLTLPAQAIDGSIALSIQASNTQASATSLAGNPLLVSKSAEEKITATGKKDIGTKATGTITITNRYRDGNGVGKDQSFAAGTKVTDNKTKKVFTLNSAVSVGRVTYNTTNGQPIYQSQSAKVTAIEPGESYNIGASTFSIEGELSDTVVESSTSFSGGLTKQVTVLSQSDVDSKIVETKKRLSEEATSEIVSKSESQKLIEGAVWEETKKQSLTSQVGAEVESATLTLEIEYGALVFDENQAVDKLKAELGKGLVDGQELVFPENKEPTFALKAYTADHQAMEVQVEGRGYKVQRVNKKDIASDINHLTIPAATQYLKDNYNAEDASVEVRPGWWFKRLPLMSRAIDIKYGFAEDTTVENDEPATEEEVVQ